MTTCSSNGKTAPVAATTETATENIPNGSPSNDTVVAYWLRNVGRDFQDHAGNFHDRKTNVLLIVPRRALVDALNGDHPDILIDRDCILAYDARINEARRQKEEVQRGIERRQREGAEERALIREITGQDFCFADLEVELVADYRAGRNVTKWLDAMKAVDDLRLQRLGLTSWGDDDE